MNDNLDYFSDNPDVFRADFFGDLPVPDGYIENIRRAISDIRHSHIALGYALIAFAESHTYCKPYDSGGYRRCVPERFFLVCEERFGLDKSSVSRHVNVVHRFGDGIDDLRLEFRDKSFSYLVELLSLSDLDVATVLYSCKTVADIRSYKQRQQSFLASDSVATSQQECDLPDSSVPVSSYSKPVFLISDDPVIQSQESAFELRPLLIPPKESYKGVYEDFRGLTLKDLLDKYIILEKELIRVTAEMKRYKMQYENEVAANSSCSCKSIPVLDFDAMDCVTLENSEV